MSRINPIDQYKIKSLIDECMEELDRKNTPTRPKTFFEKLVDKYSSFFVG